DNALTSARATLAQALREIRTLSFLLHPPSSHKAGFARMIRSFAEGFAQRSSLLLKIEIAASEEQLSPAVELILFRVCQEAFMNVRRHANASAVTLRYYQNGADAALEVEDDGIGIDAGDDTHIGVGIESMRTRLQEIGGNLEIENTGHGTLVRARAPRNIVN
ncbi:MAG TPA: ATP-binding protein, partial [Vitreimonas sp.]|nr:ATP-binding protein [Vitreimonas sp.]